MTSGLPLSVGYSATQQQQVSGLVSARPNLVPGTSIYLSGGNPINYLNAKAFSLPDYTQPFGNAPRNIARLPAFYQADFGLHKNFAITEAYNLQFRAEAFNLLNKTNFSSVSSTSFNSSTFGIFNSTFPARQFQLALRLVF